MKAKVDTVDRQVGLQSRIAIWLAFAACMIACGIASRAFAQSQSPQLSGDYYVASMEGFDTPASVRDLEGKVRIAMSDASVAAGSDGYKAVETYYTQYFWRKLSQPDAAPDLSGIVAETLRSIDSMAITGSPQLRASVLGWVRQSAINVATGKPGDKYFSPTARINATVLLANLNSEPRKGNVPPKPDLLTSSPLRSLLVDPDAPLAVRVIALSGFRRHAVLQGGAAPANAKGFYVSQAKGVLEGTGPSGLQRKDVSPDVYGFLQVYAIDMMRASGSPADMSWLVTKLNALVSDAGTSPIAANYAAKQLAKMGDAMKSLEVTAPVLVSWAERAAGTLSAEIARLQALNTPRPVVDQQILVQPKQAKGRPGMAGGPGVPGGMAGGGYPGGGGYPEGMGGGYPGAEGEGGEMPGGIGGYGSEGEYPGGGYPGGAGGYPGGGFGTMAARPQPAEVIASRRMLNATLEALLFGLAGNLDETKAPSAIASLASDEAKQCSTELLAALRTVAEECNNPAYDSRLKFLAMLEEQSETLNDWVAQYKPEEEAVEEVGEPNAEGADVALTR